MFNAVDEREKAHISFAAAGCTKVMGRIVEAIFKDRAVLKQLR